MNGTDARRTHHHGNLREALIDYALTSARSETLNELSLRRASRELGVSPGAAYKHFPDKQTLLRTVAERGFDDLSALFEQVLPFVSSAANASVAIERFIALAESYYTFAHQNYGLWRLMFGPLGLATPARPDRPSTYSWLEKSLNELSQFGVIDAIDAEGQLFAWAAIHGLSDLRASPAVSARPDRDVVLSHCEFILRALRKR